MIRNWTLVCLTVVLSSVLIELGLRVFTVFPVGEYTNQELDKDVAYRLPTDFPHVDAKGYRNPNGKWETSKIFAVGDSHTCGNNVVPEDSWPRQFEKLIGRDVYNAGLPSYGIFVYHKLVHDFLEKNPGNTVIVALYPENDFSKAISHCRIDFEGSRYWREELQLLSIAAKKIGCYSDRVEKQGFVNRTKAYLARNIAIVSLLDIAIWNKIAEFASPSDTVQIFEGVQIPRSRLGKYSEPRMNSRYELLPYLPVIAASWRRAANRNHGKLGVVLIPSRERVLSLALMEKGLSVADSEVEQIFTLGTKKEKEIDKSIIQSLTRAGIAVVDATPYVVEALTDTLNDGNGPFYWGGHPFRAGYNAYAKAAAQLIDRL
jgi:hypothetical protein